MKRKKQKFEIVSGKELYGEFKNQTSKNATLPILSASILCDGEVRLEQVPNLLDVKNMLCLLRKLGVRIKHIDNDVMLNFKNLKNVQIDCKISRTMRSSIFLLGSMLSRFGSAIITMPGGCKIGERPIDIHIKALKKLGVKVINFGEQLFFHVKKAKPGVVKLRIPSVGATENIIQFACKIKGKTTILNSAREPEVVDLCNFLNKMGAKIVGAGTKKITIYGVDKLHNTIYKPTNDRIVAGTVLTAVAICGGDVTISNTNPIENEKLIKILRIMGCQIETNSDIIHIVSNKALKSIRCVKTGYYPNFPTDMQSCVLTLMTVTQGVGVVKENIFENRFLNISQLQKMGAQIKQLNSHTVEISGVEYLNGMQVEAKDLRGGASLILAGLVAKGKTIVSNIEHIDRGYDHIETILSNLGANIRRI